MHQLQLSVLYINVKLQKTTTIWMNNAIFPQKVNIMSNAELIDEWIDIISIKV